MPVLARMIERESMMSQLTERFPVKNFQKKSQNFLIKGTFAVSLAAVMLKMKMCSHWGVKPD